MKTKVLHIITRFTIGGADENTKITCIGLDKNKYDVHLAYGHEYDNGMVDEIRKKHVKTRCFSMLRHLNPVSSLFSLISIYFYLRRNGFTIVHTHSTEAGLVGRFAAIFAGVPIIIHTVHGTPFSETRPWIVNAITLVGERIVARQTAKIVSNANILTKEYLSRSIGKKSQYVTIYSGIDLRKYQNARPIKDIKNKAGFNVLMVSRITEGKGLDEVLSAADQLVNEDIHVFIAGDGDLMQKYRQSSAKNVTFLGLRDDVPRLLASVDILVLPSYREGTPRVITEAMAAGIPVVATNIAGIPEQIEDGKNGYLIPIKDSKALADRILYLKEHPMVRTRMGRAGLKMVKKFSELKMSRDIEKLYTELLE